MNRGNTTRHHTRNCCVSISPVNACQSYTFLHIDIHCPLSSHNCAQHILLWEYASHQPYLHLHASALCHTSHYFDWHNLAAPQVLLPSLAPLWCCPSSSPSSVSRLSGRRSCLPCAAMVSRASALRRPTARPGRGGCCMTAGVVVGWLVHTVQYNTVWHSGCDEWLLKSSSVWSRGVWV